MSNLFINKTVQITGHQVLTDGVVKFRFDEDKEINEILKELYQQLMAGYSKFFKMDTLSKMGTICAELLVDKTDLQCVDYEVALVLCNRSSSLNTDVKFQETLSEIPSPAVFVYTLPNIVIGEVCIRNNFKGESAFFVQEAWDIDFNIDYVKTLFLSTATKKCLTGWLEADANGHYDARMMLVSENPSSHHFSTETIIKLFK
jgi:hypothetical protein